MRKVFLFFLFLGLVAAGCLQEPTSATPTPAASPSATVQQASPSPTPVPSPTVVVEIPTPTPAAVNYSKEELVSAYLKAVNDQDFEKAYSMVSREFKAEDPNATTLEAFRERLEQEYPYGLSFSDVQGVVTNQREILATIVKGGSSIARRHSFILVFESGFWKLRIPYPTAGKYYNKNVQLRLTSTEISRNLEIALNDFFSRLDPKVRNDPFVLDEFDKTNHVFYAVKTIKIKRNDGLQREAKIEVTFGPSFIVGGLSNTADLLEDRPLHFEYQNGIKREGGHAGFYCYLSTSKLFLKVKLDQSVADVYSYEQNIFSPIINELNKICPP